MRRGGRSRRCVGSHLREELRSWGAFMLPTHAPGQAPVGIAVAMNGGGEKRSVELIEGSGSTYGKSRRVRFGLRSFAPVPLADPEETSLLTRPSEFYGRKLIGLPLSLRLRQGSGESRHHRGSLPRRNWRS